MLFTLFLMIFPLTAYPDGVTRDSVERFSVPSSNAYSNGVAMKDYVAESEATCSVQGNRAIITFPLISKVKARMVTNAAWEQKVILTKQGQTEPMTGEGEHHFLIGKTKFTTTIPYETVEIRIQHRRPGHSAWEDSQIRCATAQGSGMMIEVESEDGGGRDFDDTISTFTYSPTRRTPATWLASLAFPAVAIKQLKEAARYNLIFSNTASNNVVTLFTDRPYRRSEHVGIIPFLQNWDAMFSDTAPNGVLVSSENDFEQTIIEIESAHFDSKSNQISMEVVLLEQDDHLPNKEFAKNIHLYIDRIDHFTEVFDQGFLIPDHNPHQKSNRVADTSNLLFSANSQEATIGESGGEYFLTLKNPKPIVHVFKAHPEREASTIPIQGLLGSAWDHIFGDDPPNAVISAQKEGHEIKDLVVTLDNPLYNVERNELTFSIKGLDGKPPPVGDYSHVNLYIDSWWDTIKKVAQIGALIATCGAAVIVPIVGCVGTAFTACVPAMIGAVAAGTACAIQIQETWLNDDLSSKFTHAPKGTPFQLDKYLPEKYRGQTYTYSEDNSLSQDWLLASPRNVWGKRHDEFDQAEKCESGPDCDTDFGLKTCDQDSDCNPSVGVGRCEEVQATVHKPGGKPQKLCVGHSDFVYDEIYKTITSAEKFVDITHLGSIPDGRWKVAIQNAMSYLSYKDNPPIVRVLFGITNSELGLKPIKLFQKYCRTDSRLEIRDIWKTIPSSHSLDLTIGVGIVSQASFSWNHSKTVAVDGRKVITGGHNYLSERYLDELPVFDVSMKLDGSAATGAHYFINKLWDNLIQLHDSWYNWPKKWHCGRQISYLDSGTRTEPPVFDDNRHKLPPEHDGDTPVFAVGNLAAIDNEGNQIDQAVFHLLKIAKNSLYFSQQDLGPYEQKLPGFIWKSGGWPAKLFLELGRALKRGVEAHMILSNKDAEHGYSYGYTQEEIIQQFFDTLVASGELGTRSEISDLICKQFNLYSARYSEFNDEYQDHREFPNRVANHAKTILVDRHYFLIGSHNLYNHNHNEFALIVDSQQHANEYWTQYWEPYVKHSKISCASGENCQRTTVQECKDNIKLHNIKDEL